MEMTECQLESYIREFIFERTQERVELVLSKDLVIRPVDKKGSILLAVFWAKVFQHPKNFPPPRYPYQKIRLPGAKADLLIVRVDDVVITVDMASGKLTLQSGFIYQWFKDNLVSLLKRYDPYCHPEKSWTCKGVKLSIPKTLPLISDDIQIKSPAQLTDRDLPPAPRNTSEIPIHLEEKIKGIALTEELISGVEDVTVDKMGILTDQKLASAIEDARTGGVQDGFSEVYRLWKSLLYKWFSSKVTRVVIVTPLMDAKRLKDIVTLFLLFRSTAKIEAIYLPRKSDEIRTKAMLGMQQEVLYEFPNKLHPYIEYMVFRKITYPIKNFHASFIAGIEDDKVYILQTSASFHSKHFRSDTMEFLHFQNMKLEEFQTKCMTPLASQIIIL